MTVTDEILNEWSFRCHDGIVDLNDPKKLRILKEILDELGIDEEKQARIFKKTSNKSFNDLIETKNLSKKIKDTVITSLSEIEKQEIANNASNDISKIISFLNNNSDIIKKTFDIKEKDMGRGEVTLIIASLDGQKIVKKGELGDVIIGGKSYELKEANDKTPIRAGGTFRSPVTALTTTLWLLKDEIFDGNNKEKYRDLLGDNLFSRWQEFGKKVKGDENNKQVNWTSFGKKQLPQLKSFLSDLRNKFIEISSSDKLKPEFTIGGKAFDVTPEDIQKIQQTDINQNISISGKVIPASGDYEEIQRFRGVIKTLLGRDIFNMDGDQIDNDIKRSFIEELDGGLVIVSANKFDFITPEEFINRFDFVGITQGNRPQFSPKGAEITEEDLDEDYYYEN
jgi:hypothetical protein